MVNGLGLGLGLWSGLRLSRMINGLGLGFGLWCGLRLRATSGLRLRGKVICLGFGLVA